MKRIFKYSLEILDRQEVELPAGAKILSVQAQNGLPQIWAMVDDSQVKTDMVHIRIIGTGYEIPDADSLEYIGTVQLINGECVFHVFKEVLEFNDVYAYMLAMGMAASRKKGGDQ